MVSPPFSGCRRCRWHFHSLLNVWIVHSTPWCVPSSCRFFHCKLLSSSPLELSPLFSSPVKNQQLFYLFSHLITLKSRVTDRRHALTYKKEREIAAFHLMVHFLNACQQLGLGQAESRRLHLGSQMSGRNSGTWAITCCLLDIFS